MGSPGRRIEIAVLVVILTIPSTAGRASDCNQNRVDDPQDISSGASLDCNENLIPDECDVLPVNYGLKEAATISTSPAEGPLSLLDLDGDADLDLAFPDTQAHLVFLFMNRGGLRFEAPTEVPASFKVELKPTEMAAGDLNGDGVDDLATANFDSDDVAVLINDRRGAFSPSRYEVGWRPRSIGAADLDGDGDLDLAVVGGYDTFQVDVLRNRGPGTFEPAVSYSINTRQYPGIPSVTLGDLDGDGAPEILTALDSERFMVLENAGDGTFPSQASLPIDGRSSTLADLDRDGDLDAITDFGAIYLNPGRGAFGPPAFSDTRAGGWGRPSAADLDSDGDPDALMETTGGPVALLNEGQGKFSISGRLAGRWIPVTADLDGDGVVEVVTPLPSVKVLSRSPVAYSADCNRNRTPDECELRSGVVQDCNRNWIPDECDLAAGSPDCNRNGILDVCETDCNQNGIEDSCDLAAGLGEDLDHDGRIDNCDSTFSFGFEAPAAVTGMPGESRTFEVHATVTAAGGLGEYGAQGWSLSLFSEGGTVDQVTVKGLQVSTVYDDASGNHYDPFVFDLGASSFLTAKLAAKGQDPSKKGAISVVTMNAVERMALKARTTQRVARLTVSATIPEGDACASLRLYYEDGGIVGCCNPVHNLVVYRGAVLVPETMKETTILLCPSRFFRRGDANSDGAVDISDPVFTLSYLFLGGATPDCLEATDANDDRLVDLSDAVYVLESLFVVSGGLNRIPAPGARTCGIDGTFPGLSCDSSPCPPQLPGAQ